MATNLEQTVSSLERRLSAVETRINEIQTMMQNLASDRALTGVQVALTDEINTLRSSLAASQAEIETIKTRLRL